jgi:hypothetical protein
VPESVSQDKDDTFENGKLQSNSFQKAKALKVWFHTQSTLARILDTVSPIESFC